MRYSRVILAASFAASTLFVPGHAFAQQTEDLKLPGAGMYGFARSVAMSGDTALVGSFGDADGAPVGGSVHVFRYDGTTWVDEARLSASDGADQDFFGWSLALSGDTAIVGAPRDDESQQDGGSAYVFRYDGMIWKEEAKLLAWDGGFEHMFGFSVALSGDTALVGAKGHNNERGSAYVYVYDGTQWVLQAQLFASDGGGADFGHSVALSGERSIVGALYGNNDDVGSGSAYVYRRDGNSWKPEAEFNAWDAAAGDHFGSSVALADGIAVVGAPRQDTGLGGDLRGAAYVFRHDGTTWVEDAKLLAFDGEAQNSLGWSVSLSDDAVIVGDIGEIDKPGSAYVYRHDGTTWIEEAELIASDGAAGDSLGAAVALHSGTALVGSPFAVAGGSAYVYFVPEPQPRVLYLSSVAVVLLLARQRASQRRHGRP